MLRNEANPECTRSCLTFPQCLHVERDSGCVIGLGTSSFECWQRHFCLFFDSPCWTTQPCSEALSLRLFFLLAKIKQSNVVGEHFFISCQTTSDGTVWKICSFVFSLLCMRRWFLYFWPLTLAFLHHFSSGGCLFSFHMVLLEDEQCVSEASKDNMENHEETYYAVGLHWRWVIKLISDSVSACSLY